MNKHIFRFWFGAPFCANQGGGNFRLQDGDPKIIISKWLDIFLIGRDRILRNVRITPSV